MNKDDKIRQQVSKRYGEIAKSGGGCGCSSSQSCCGSAPASPDSQTMKLGYSQTDLDSIPTGANMGLGCGNPHAIASLKPGEIVLDLGAGGGLDCFLAAGRVGEKGRVIGVDMTPEMVMKARQNAERSGIANVEFRLGEIEHLPVADSSVDVIISNCVINLSPDKPQVYREALRVLKSGGRIAFSDTVRLKDFPSEWLSDDTLLCSCVTGSASAEEIRNMLQTAGFTKIQVKVKPESREIVREWAPGTGVEDYVASAEIVALKS